jgi:mannose-6-phosphate isomerase
MTTPLTFKPVYKDYLWGGDCLASQFQRAGTPTANGAYAGRSLPELAIEFGTSLMGTKTPDPTRFPLLFKLIDARDKLSVQVHPNNSNAALTHGEPKTEMWYVLDRIPGACLYAGLREGTTPEVLRAALASGTADKCLTEVQVNPGDSIFIPGGLVHAIGGGSLIGIAWARMASHVRSISKRASRRLIGEMRECENARKKIRECANARVREWRDTSHWSPAHSFTSENLH